MTAGEKADRISALLFQIAMQGGMFALQAKSMATVAAALKQRNASLTQIRVIGRSTSRPPRTSRRFPMST
ncbi:MAG: hypothetical protein AB7O24_06400 [Kofleriaceae bacterium]